MSNHKLSELERMNNKSKKLVSNDTPQALNGTSRAKASNDTPLVSNDTLIKQAYMVNLIVLVADAQGVLRDQEGLFYNVDG